MLAFEFAFVRRRSSLQKITPKKLNFFAIECCSSLLKKGSTYLNTRFALLLHTLSLPSCSKTIRIVHLTFKEGA